MTALNPDEALKLAQEQADQDARLEDEASVTAALDQGERIGELEKKIEQLQHSTIDGALIERLLISDGQGGIRGVVGGASGLQIKDSTQPTPTTPILEEVSDLGVVEVRWDGFSAELDPEYTQTFYFWDGEPENSISLKQSDDQLVARNFHKNPRGSGTVRWTTGSGEHDYHEEYLAGQNDGPLEGVREYHRVYVHEPAPSGSGGWSTSNDQTAVSPAEGMFVTYSYFVRYTGTLSSVTYRPRLYFYDDSGELIDFFTSDADLDHPNGEWVQATVTAPAPEGTAYVSMWHYFINGDSAEAGSTVDITAQHIGIGSTVEESLEQVEDFFDGNLEDDTKRKDIPKGSAFGRVQTRHRLIEGGVQPDPEGPDWREGGAIGSFHGGTTTVALGQPGTHAIWFYMAGPNGLEKSEFSQPLIVEVEPLVDRDEIQQWIDEKGEELEEYVHDFGNREGTTVPAEDAPEGVIYYQKDDQGRVIGIWQSRGAGDWVGLPLNSEVLVSVTTDKLVAGESLIDGVLIKDGAITLTQMTIDGELVAEIAKIITIEADNIAANAIDGMTITGGLLIGGEVRGGIVRIGSGAQETVIDGINNRFAGRILTTGTNGSMVEIDTDFSSMAGIRFNTGSSADSEPTLLAINKAGFFTGEGSITLSGRQTVESTSNRADFTLYPNGDFALRHGEGSYTNIGIWKNGRELDLQGRHKNLGSVGQTLTRASDSLQIGASAKAGITYTLTPPPVGSYHALMSPKRLNTSSPGTAQSGITQETASKVDAWVAFPSEGTLWRVNLVIWWK